MEWIYGQVKLKLDNKYTITEYSSSEKLILLINIMDEYFDYWYECKDNKFHFVDRVYKHWEHLNTPYWFNLEICKHCRKLRSIEEKGWCGEKCFDCLLNSRLNDNTYELFFNDLTEIILWIISNSNGNEPYYNLLKSFMERK